MRPTTIAAVLVLVGGCAAQPALQAPATPPAERVAVAPSSGSAAATGAPIAAPAQAASATPANDAKYVAFVKYARTQGYKPVKTDDGKEYWLSLIHI